MFLYLASFEATGQQDTVTLSEVTVEDQRLQPAPGTMSYPIPLDDGQGLPSNMSDVLSRSTPVFIKNYGPGQISTSGIRGTSAQHTDVLWNGISVNNPGLGQTNFSLLPVRGFSSGNLVMGNGSVFNSSGGFGGVLMLETPSRGMDTLSGWISTIGGSFSTFRGEGEIEYKGFRVYGQEYGSRNDYPYLNYTLPDQPIQNMVNSGYRGRNWMVDGGIHMLGGYLSLHGWYQDQTQDLPPPISAFHDPDRRETLRQNALRMAAVLSIPKDRSGWVVRMAGMKTGTDYENQVERTKTEFYTYLTQVLFKQHLDHVRWQIGGEARYDRWKGTEVEQTSWNLYLSAQWDPLSSLAVTGMVRAIGNGYFSGPQASIGLQYSLLSDLYFDVNLGRNLRLPTLNDLYYPQGGNPDLLPEEGYNTEVAIRWEGWITTSIRGYRQWVTNWIQWQPMPGNSIWSPQNIQTVRTHGLEFQASRPIHMNSWTLRPSFMYQWTIAKGDQDGQENEKILIYVPEHQVKVNFQVEHNDWTLGYRFIWVDKVFIDRTNMGYLPHWMTHGLSLGYSLTLNGHRLIVMSDIGNMLNYDYQVVAGRPMPRQQFNFGVTWRF